MTVITNNDVALELSNEREYRELDDALSTLFSERDALLAEMRELSDAIDSWSDTIPDYDVDPFGDDWEDVLYALHYEHRTIELRLEDLDAAIDAALNRFALL